MAWVAGSASNKPRIARNRCKPMAHLRRRRSLQRARGACPAAMDGHRVVASISLAASPSFLLAPVHRAAVLHRARFDLDVEALAQQVLQREYLAGAEQRHAVADVEFWLEVLAHAEHAAAERARIHHAGLVEADVRGELPGEQAAARRERGGGRIELAILVRARRRQRAAE